MQILQSLITNREWLCSLTDEELADFLAKTIAKAAMEGKMVSLNGVLDWLGRKHEEGRELYAVD